MKSADDGPVPVRAVGWAASAVVIRFSQGAFMPPAAVSSWELRWRKNVPGRCRPHRRCGPPSPVQAATDYQLRGDRGDTLTRNACIRPAAFAHDLDANWFPNG
jgi:hypothetical protein